MSDVAVAYDILNLRRAWRWINSNTDAAYKQYCRSLYTAYEVAEDTSLADLRERLRRGTYVPTHATKTFLPKASGILRPYSILTVEDQVVYQAFANVVADKLFPRVRHRYMKEVFGHLYAGRRSAFFYRKWENGYTALNDACRKAFEKGFVFGASFDLTACYDSLDHGVLCHFLRKIGCDPDFEATLSGHLCHWTATNHGIYHNHGIPQGPLSSGLIAEVVLQHFDDHRGSPADVRYVRYVDDIRLFARTPLALRRMLVRLDMLSKDIGLFPQSSKVHIHRIIDIEEELKSISNPPEAALGTEAVDQKKLRKRLVELTPRFRVTNATRFKYLLACAKPSARLNERLWKVLDAQPHLFPSILRYFQRYTSLPPSVAIQLIDVIQSRPLYHALHAELIRTADGRLPADFQAEFQRVVMSQWHPSKASPDVTAALGCVAVKEGLLTYAQMLYAATSAPDWWVRSQIVECLTPNVIGEPSLEAIANAVIRGDAVDDVCMMAAFCMQRYDLSVHSPSRDVSRRAAHVLRKYGRMPQTYARRLRHRPDVRRSAGPVGKWN